MTKKIVLTAFIALTATFVALAQTDATRTGTETAPAKKIERAENAKTNKSADKAKTAEQKPEGTTYKGRSKDGKKNGAVKGAKGTRAKGAGHANGQSKDKANRPEGPDGKPAAGERENHDGHQHADDQNPDEAAHKPKVEKINKSGQADHKAGNRPTTVKEKENDH